MQTSRNDSAYLEMIFNLHSICEALVYDGLESARAMLKERVRHVSTLNKGTIPTVDGMIMISGKDPTKVDRSGAYMARKIARDIVLAGYAEKCEVQIAYAIGLAEPVSIHVECFGTAKQDRRFIEQFIRENYDLTPKGIIKSLRLLDVDYNKVSSLGHFGKSGLPWEK